MKNWILVGVLAVAGGALAFNARADNATEAVAKVKAGAVLLDVRTVEEFGEGHIKGAINIPVQNLAERLKELPAKDKPIVVYCHSGARSARARRMLMDAGYKDVMDIGGMSNWKGP
jgi:phage shock protein E